MARYEAFIENHWEESGVANIMVTRFLDNGSADYGMFLVDLYCLGVKNAWGEKDLTASRVRDLVAENLEADVREPFDPACAKKMIEGAIAYAQRFGFAPHRDFRKARKVLSGIDASACSTAFTYGKDGLPCYIRGPDDEETRVHRILGMLDARCGHDGYTFIDPSAGPEGFSDDDDEDEGVDLLTLRENLLAWLDSEPPQVLRFYELSGLLTGAILSPQPVSPLKLLDVVFGPAGRTWGTLAETEKFIRMLMLYWNHLGDMVMDCTEPDSPTDAHPVDIWMEDFEGDQTQQFVNASIEWAIGFKRAMEIDRSAWASAIARADLAPFWDIVRCWSQFDEPDCRETAFAAMKEQPPRTLSRCVAILARALRPPT